MCSQASVRRSKSSRDAAVEPLVEEPEHPLGRRQPQPQVELEVELLEVAALEALEDHLVPAEARQGQGGLVGLPAPGRPCPTRRSRRGPPPLAVVERDVVEDVEVLVDPALGGVVPPGVLVHQDHADPAVQRLLDPPVALPALRPAQQLDQLVPRELDPGVGEVAPPLGQLDQADQHLVVQRGRQPVLVRPHDRQPPDDRRAVATLELVLEDQRRLAVGDPVRQRGDRELGQVQLVLPAGVLRRASLPRSARSLRVSSSGSSHSSIPIDLRRARRWLTILESSSDLESREKTNNKTAGRLLLSFSLNKSLKQILCDARG